MIVLYLEMTFRAPLCNSLKDKRSVVRRLTARLRAATDVCVCEAGMQDHQKQIVLAAVALAFTSAQADSIAQRLVDTAESDADAALIRVEKEYR